jgi:hypothetical protein
VSSSCSIQLCRRTCRTLSCQPRGKGSHRLEDRHACLLLDLDRVLVLRLRISSVRLVFRICLTCFLWTRFRIYRTTFIFHPLRLSHRCQAPVWQRRHQTDSQRESQTNLGPAGSQTSPLYPSHNPTHPSTPPPPRHQRQPPSPNPLVAGKARPAQRATSSISGSDAEWAMYVECVIRSVIFRQGI